MKVGIFFYLTVIIVVGIIVGGITFGTYSSNQRYYDVVDKCIDHGGTWMPTLGNGTCLGPSLGVIKP